MLSKHLVIQTSPKACPENILRWKNYRITLLTETRFRIEEDDRTLFCDEATKAIWFRNMTPIVHAVEATGEACVIRTSTVTLCLKDKPARQPFGVS